MKDTAITVLVNYSTRQYEWTADPEYNFKFNGTVPFAKDLSESFDTMYDQVSAHFDRVEFEIYRPICVGDIVKFKRNKQKFTFLDGEVVSIENGTEILCYVQGEIDYNHFTVKMFSQNIPERFKKSPLWRVKKDEVILVEV